MRVISIVLGFSLAFAAFSAHGAENSTSKGQMKAYKSKHHAVSVDEVKGPMKWGTVNATKFHRHYFAGAMTEEAYKAAQAEGIKTAIDLRHSSELSGGEAELAAKYGMKYVNIPVETGKPFDKTAFEKIETVFSEKNGKNLLFCGSSNRAGAWFSTHLAKTHNVNLEESLAIGRKVGMRSPQMEEAVKEYLARK